MRITFTRVARLLVVGLLGATSLAAMGANVVPKVHEKQATTAETRQPEPTVELPQSELEQRRLTAMANTMFIFDDSPFNRSPTEQRSSSAVTSISAVDNANWPRPGVWSGYLATVLLGCFFVFRRIR